MFTEKHLELHGERIAYRDEGDGEVILLLHGMAGTWETWRALIGPLSREHRVIAPDLLGHGNSAKPRSDYSLGAFAVLLRDFLDELGVDRVTVVGHSLGGGIAMQFSYQHPGYTDRLVLIASGGLGADVGWLLRLASLPGAEIVIPLIAPRRVIGAGERLWPWLRKVGIESARGQEMWRHYGSLSDGETRQTFLRTLRSVVDHRGQAVSALSRLTSRTDIPALVIWGERDAIIPVAHAHAAREVRPDARLVVLEDVGHFPHAERPAEVAELITEFLAEQTVTAMLRRGNDR